MSFLQSRQKQLGVIGNMYMLFVILLHSQIPTKHVWTLAAIFSIVMNFPYVIEALSVKNHLSQEVALATFLIVLSALGALLSPPLVITAVFGHGVWDFAKHRGAGVPFFAWYTLPCAAFDFSYGSLLFIFWKLQAVDAALV